MFMNAYDTVLRAGSCRCDPYNTMPVRDCAGAAESQSTGAKQSLPSMTSAMTSITVFNGGPEGSADRPYTIGIIEHLGAPCRIVLLAVAAALPMLVFASYLLVIQDTVRTDALWYGVIALVAVVFVILKKKAWTPRTDSTASLPCFLSCCAAAPPGRSIRRSPRLTRQRDTVSNRALERPKTRTTW